jgi:hypothetical protein
MIHAYDDIFLLKRPLFTKKKSLKKQKPISLLHFIDFPHPVDIYHFVLTVQKNSFVTPLMII